MIVTLYVDNYTEQSYKISYFNKLGNQVSYDCDPGTSVLRAINSFPLYSFREITPEEVKISETRIKLIIKDDELMSEFSKLKM